jgi:hypothetical protein
MSCGAARDAVSEPRKKVESASNPIALIYHTFIHRGRPKAGAELAPMWTLFIAEIPPTSGRVDHG